MFESHAEHLGPQLFRDFAFPYLKQICDQVKEQVQLLGLPDTPMVSTRTLYKQSVKLATCRSVSIALILFAPEMFLDRIARGGME